MKSFNYNVEDDPIYKQYARAYIRNGQRAMRDTVGTAADLTGGYASSYAVSAGSQAYDRYLEKLNEMVPNFYASAYGRYRDAVEDEYRRQKDEAAQREQNYKNLYQLISTAGYSPTDEELKGSGMSREQAKALLDEYLKKYAKPKVIYREVEKTPELQPVTPMNVAIALSQFRKYKK